MLVAFGGLDDSISPHLGTALDMTTDPANKDALDDLEREGHESRATDMPGSYGFGEADGSPPAGGNPATTLADAHLTGSEAIPLEPFGDLDDSGSPEDG